MRVVAPIALAVVLCVGVVGCSSGLSDAQAADQFIEAYGMSGKSLNQLDESAREKLGAAVLTYCEGEDAQHTEPLDSEMERLGFYDESSTSSRPALMVKLAYLETMKAAGKVCGFEVDLVDTPDGGMEPRRK